MVASASRKNGSFKSASAERPRRRGLNSPVCLHFLYQYFFLYLKRKLEKERKTSSRSLARIKQDREEEIRRRNARVSLPPPYCSPIKRLKRPLGGIIITERAFCSGSFFSICSSSSSEEEAARGAPDDARLLATLAQRRRSNEPPVAVDTENGVKSDRVSAMSSVVVFPFLRFLRVFFISIEKKKKQKRRLLKTI